MANPNDDATLVIGAGNYFTGAVGAAAPTDLLVPGVPWTNVGHTSIEDILSLASEGGDETILATLQNKTLRTKKSARTEKLNFTIMQFDTPSLKLYYGSNAPSLSDGMVGVPTDPQPTTCAFLAVFVDGSNVFGFWAPKAEIFRADDMAVQDAESLVGLPLAVTPLQYQTNNFTYAVTPLGDAGP